MKLAEIKSASLLISSTNYLKYVDESIRKLHKKEAAASGKEIVSERAQFCSETLLGWEKLCLVPLAAGFSVSSTFFDVLLFIPFIGNFFSASFLVCFCTRVAAKNTAHGLALKYNNVLGRHLTASRELKAGEILIIKHGLYVPIPANAYCMTSLHCFKATYNRIPYYSFVFAVYCSEKCKHDAWTSYHDKECTEYDYYKILKVGMEYKMPNLTKFIIQLMIFRRLLIISLEEANEKSIHIPNFWYWRKSKQAYERLQDC